MRRKKGKGNRNGGAAEAERRNGKREWAIGESQKREKMKKVGEKREGDMVYVIRGDGIVVGVMSRLDWQAG